MSTFKLCLVSSDGVYTGNLPTIAPDGWTINEVNSIINSRNPVAWPLSKRWTWDNDRATCQALDGLYGGAPMSQNFTYHIRNNIYMELLYSIDLYDDNDQPTGYKIVVGPTRNYDIGDWGFSIALMDINNNYIRSLAGTGQSQNHSAHVAYFMWENPDGNIIFGALLYDNGWNPVRDLDGGFVSMKGWLNNAEYRQYGTTIKSAVVSDEFGTPSEEGGYTGGTFDDSSDTIAIPTMPTIGVTSAGFVNVYNPSVNALQGFGAELFPDLTFSSSSHISGSLSVADAIEAAANALVDLGNQIPNIVNMYINSNLINYVIDCHILPVAPTVGAGANIKVGFKQFTASAPVVTSDYVDFDCGTLNVGEYYANFIDYSPYTRARLFLPFVGFVDLQPEFFQSGTVNIVYRFNIIDGSFMCYVLSTSSKSKLTNSVIMQFGGNACVHIPITGLNYSSMVSGVVGGAASMVASQAGVSGLNQRAGSAITSAITSAVDVAQSKPPVQASNGYNATTSFLSVRTPYLLIERSVSNFSIKYTEEKGVPSNITSDFSTLTGFTQATAVHLDGIGATEAEKNEIAALLAQGVIL